MNPAEFNRRVLSWFDAHGRKQLPWQENTAPYPVWVSEIMLQQTQVATVIPYYRRFIDRFPDVQTLASAELDEILGLWAGLGYYARARHLHQAARIVCDRYGGEMPLEITALQELPGIGRSTAGAILAFAAGQRQSILDGNVKRLLARFAAVEGWPGQPKVQALLWELAERYTPAERVADYTQAIMDLGALICMPRRPRCLACPLAEACIAHAQGREMDYPSPKPRPELPTRSTRMVLLRSAAGEVLLEHRPPVGIWGGLWCFPECPPGVEIADWCWEQLGLTVSVGMPWRVLRHGFSHFRLDISPIPATASGVRGTIMDGERFVWYNTCQLENLGIPAPVRLLLTALTTKLAND